MKCDCDTLLFYRCVFANATKHFVWCEWRVRRNVSRTAAALFPDLQIFKHGVLAGYAAGCGCLMTRQTQFYIFRQDSFHWVPPLRSFTLSRTLDNLFPNFLAGNQVHAEIYPTKNIFQVENWNRKAF